MGASEGIGRAGPFSAALAFYARYCGVVIETVEGRLLLQQRDGDPTIRNAGLLSLFGGVARLSETHLDAARRELREELGILTTAADLTEFDSYVKVEDDQSRTECHFFRLRFSVNPDEVVVAEGSGLRELALADALEDPHVTPATKRALSVKDTADPDTAD